MTVKRKLNVLKSKAWELMNNGQIPKYLYHLICHLDENSSEREVRFLMEITENAMRVKFFYKNHKDLALQVSKEIEDLYRKFKENEENGNN